MGNFEGVLNDLDEPPRHGGAITGGEAPGPGKVSSVRDDDYLLGLGISFCEYPGMYDYSETLGESGSRSARRDSIERDVVYSMNSEI